MYISQGICIFIYLHWKNMKINYGFGENYIKCLTVYEYVNIDLFLLDKNFQ